MKVVNLLNWNPSQSFRMYIRKDIAAQIWQYGVSTGSVDISSDPYEGGKLEVAPKLTFSNLGLQNPRGLTIGPDGNIYIADTGNNRIVHLSNEQTITGQWGTEGSEFGQFNQPWDVAVGLDGSVYVTDTWNHRIQKFTSSGEFIRAWGVYGQGETPTAFWGPRGITVDQQGNVVVTDTGNKRIVIFTPDGEFVDEFGSVGFQLGEFDEPVGVEASPVSNMLIVADTWNQRVQSFEFVPDFGYTPVNSWEIDGWYGQSLENKPFLAADSLNRVFVADPEAGRVLVFSFDGSFISTFGDYDPFGSSGFGIIGGIASDDLGGVWVSDSVKNEIKYFTLP